MVKYIFPFQLHILFLVMKDFSLSANSDRTSLCEISSLLFHPEEQILLSATLSGHIDFNLYDEDFSVSRSAVDFQPHKTGSIRALEYLNGKLVSVDSAGKVCLSSFDPKVIRRWKLGSEGIGAVCAVPKSSLVICGNDDGEIFGLDIRQKDPDIFRIKEQSDFISSIIIGKPNELKTIVATSGDCTLGVYDLRKTSNSLVALSDEQEDEMNCALLMNSEQHVLTGNANGVVGVWKQGYWGDVKDRVPLYNKGKLEGACSIDFLKKIDENQYLATTSDGIIRLMNLYPNTTKQIVGVHRTADNQEVGTITAMDCDLSSGLVATTNGDELGTIKFWNFNDKQSPPPSAKKLKSAKSQHVNPDKANRQGFFGEI